MFRVPQLPSDSSLSGPASRSCEFRFEIPRPGEEMPPTFCASMPCDSRRGGLSVVEKAEVSYCVTAVWESSDVSETSGMWSLNARASLACLLLRLRVGSSYSFSSGYRRSVYGRFQYRAGIMPRNASHNMICSVPLRCHSAMPANVFPIYIFCYIHNKTSMCCTCPRNCRRCHYCCFPSP
ncbi:hypothetical protein BDR03DRAFT_964380 [Suillus americanus]|nr:hypothetical protein BDR03DRAFT_964380 [Suillus americanus]